MLIHKKIMTVFIVVMSTAAYAQDPSMKTLTLDDMSAFKTQAGNWQIVGDVTIDRLTDIHHPEASKAPAETGKKKKKSSEAAVAAAPKAVTFVSGKGVLLNMNDDTKKDNLVTAFEHGDIELELEVMLPKGSNSGIYLQGRYEVQLLDSWGVKNPSFSDIGGIYRNWEKEPGKIYMGKAPLSNPAKAPGLWQKMKISFRAPKFDSNGKKIANARFVSVELNGVKIHDNVEVPLPTGGPVENNEKASGPLMIQGDHGPVAFRNIKYRTFKDLKISVSEISYKTYDGNFKEIAEFANAKPVKSGSSPELSIEVLDNENAYGVIYKGKISVPEENTYTFSLRYTGGTKLTINNQTLIDIQRPDGGGENKAAIKLSAGTYDFEIDNYKDASWMPPRLGLYAQTENSFPVTLTAYNSFPPDENPVSPIFIHAGSTPKLLRAFVDFKGDRSQRLTHTIGVGEPAGINYVYDLESGNLACVWRGDFVDATPMWHDRGDGSFKPLGSAQYLFIGQPLAFLSNNTEAFPVMGKEGDFKTKGYVLDENGRPVFKFIYQGLEVEDKVVPEDNNRSIGHEITIKNRGSKTGLYYKLAEGKNIVALSDGSYAIDDKQFYITSSSAATIREVNGKKELVVAVDGSSVKYSIIW
jgi:hypothetical protein